MARGRKTGGRAPGTPNRTTAEVRERLESLGCDPIAGMARIAMNPRVKVEVRARIYAELAQYVYPKRKAVEVGGLGESPLQTRLEIVLVPAVDGRPVEGACLP